MHEFDETTFERLADIIRKVVVRRLRAYPSWERLQQEVDDITYSALVALIKSASKVDSNIGDLEKVARKAANNAVNEFFVVTFRVRGALDKSLRYYIGKHSGLVICDEESEKPVTYTQWLKAPPPESARFARLEENPEKVWNEVFDGAPIGKDLGDLVKQILDWAGCPVPYGLVLTVISEATGRKDSSFEIPEEKADASASADKTAWLNQSLEQLWAALTKLIVAQIRAILLNLRDPQGKTAIEDLVEVRVCSKPEIATVLEFELDFLMKIWDELPWEDKAIAVFMHCTVNDVSNLRALGRRQLVKQLGADFASISLSW